MECLEEALARIAIERWPTLAEELDADLQYRQSGHLMLAENKIEAEHLQTFVQSRRGLRFADISFLDRKAVFGLVPGLGEQVVAGIFSPASGQANPRLTTRSFANAAQRHGAIYWTGVECIALQLVAERVVGAQTGHGFVQAKQIVITAGAWSRELASSIGIQLPLRMRVLQALLTTPAPPEVLHPVLSLAGRALSLKQLSDGALLLGGGWSGDPTSDCRSYTLREESQRGNWVTACELFPLIRNLRCVDAWGGFQAHNLDDLPFIGSFSGLDGLTLALGSWYGFALAPAIGDSVANHLAGLPTTELDQLSPDRITQIDPEKVAAFLTEPATSNVVE